MFWSQIRQNWKINEWKQKVSGKYKPVKYEWFWGKYSLFLRPYKKVRNRERRKGLVLHVIMCSIMCYTFDRQKQVIYWAQTHVCRHFKHWRTGCERKAFLDRDPHQYSLRPPLVSFTRILLYSSLKKLFAKTFLFFWQNNNFILSL